jgi:hypothetical protein
MINKVAIKDTNSNKIYGLDKPFRHHNVIDLIIDLGIVDEVHPPRFVQGFLDDNGIFLTREEAGIIAESEMGIKMKWSPRLFSEDLW